MGFDACGVARADYLSAEADHLRHWLDAGAQAEMAYMARNVDKRTDPRLLLEGAKSVMVLLMSYKPAAVQPETLPQIAQFAYGNDYHDIIKEKLHCLKSWLQAYHPEVPVRGFVDTAPLLERAWAVKAGLGWVGKNNLLISPEYGSFTFLATLVTGLELDYDSAFEGERCGACRKCLDACPTGALCQAYFLDARRCVAYHTIESKSTPQVNARGYIFGCDRCQNACPWNVQAPAHRHEALTPLPEIFRYTASDWLSLDEPEFNRIFASSPLRRTGLARLRQIVSMHSPFTLSS